MGNLITGYARIPAIAAELLAVGLALTGCSGSTSVMRDESGKPTASPTANAFNAKVGDGIKNPEQTTVTDVTVTPAISRTTMKPSPVKTWPGSP
ncbi:MAG: hypothetical protein HIU81_05380 [Acidobacteria bacterium]|nr:hypothetical protein [Acidobacteriota bacterium]